MKVLSLVTNENTPFYKTQVKTLQNLGIEITSCSLKQALGRTNERYNSSFVAFLDFYFNTIKETTKKYDLVHANYGSTAPLAIAQPIRPIILTLWGSDLMSGGVFKKSTKFCSHYFDEVIIPSKSMAPFLSRDYKFIPFGIDTNLFSPIPKEYARKKLGWDTSKPIVLFPYNPDRKVKNFDLAEKIVTSLSDNIELKTVFGVPHEKMPYYYNASDSVLITSARESGPLVVKEAALCNVPVVSTDVGFAYEVLEGVSESFVCNSERELRNKLRYLIKEDKRSNGRKKIKDKVSLKKMGKQIIEVYNQALENK